MNLEAAAPRLAERSWTDALSLALRFMLMLALVAIVIQAAIVVRARPQDLITGAYGMADIIRRAMPPDFGKIDMVWWPALETIDLAIFGTLGGVIMALPLANSRGRERDAVALPLLRRARRDRLRPRRS